MEARCINHAFLLIGGNQGDRARHLAEARAAIEEDCGPLRRASAVYETEAWGLEDQPPFLNQALEVETHLPPHELLAALLSIETRLGRVRDQRYGPRLIDIDILLYGESVIDTPALRVPHPELPRRRFALVPLHEIAPGLLHPELQQTIGQLLTACPDPLTVHKIS